MAVVLSLQVAVLSSCLNIDIEDLWGREGKSPLIVGLDSGRQKWSASRHGRFTHRKGAHRFPLHMTVGGRQIRYGWFGVEEKLWGQQAIDNSFFVQA